MTQNVQKFSIKDIRRIETEVDEEIHYVTNGIHNIRQEHQQLRIDAFAVGEKGVRASLAKFEELVDTRFAIRGIVAKFNDANGIDDRTAKIAKLEQRKTFVDDSIVGFGRPGTTRDYRNDTVVHTPGLKDDIVDEFRAESRNIKRQIQRLKDSCNGINSNTSFEVDPVLVEVFTKYGFIDKQ